MALKENKLVAKYFTSNKNKQNNLDATTAPHINMTLPPAESAENVSESIKETGPPKSASATTVAVPIDLNSNSSADGSTAKNANQYFRWNLAFLLFIIVMLTFPIWFSFIPVVNIAALEVILALMILIQLIWVTITICAVKNVYIVRQHIKRLKSAAADVEAGGNTLPTPTETKIRHIMGITVYKEPLDVLTKTVNSLARQAHASDKIVMVIGMEEGTPEKDMKKTTLMEKYKKAFLRFIVTEHPKGVEGEIPGKCSNYNYSSRTAVKTLRDDQTYGFEQYEHIITTGDCDSIFPHDYFDVLEKTYLSTDNADKDGTIFQSPLFYQIGIDKSPFFVRATGLLRSFFMLGVLIPWNINTMSIFSLSLKLYELGGYTHPGYQMDDIIAVIRWTLKTKKVLRIKMLDVATMSGPTSGATYLGELSEWARQIRRWTIGAAEVFHYFVIKSNRIPRFAAFTWGTRFFIYYGSLLCVAPLFSIIAPPIVMLLHEWQFGTSGGPLIPNNQIYSFIMLGLLVLQYFWFAVVFWVNAAASVAFPDGIRDKTKWYISFIHWLLTLPTILAYCVVELVAFVEVAFRGKQVCTHGASKKDNLRYSKRSTLREHYIKRFSQYNTFRDKPQ